MRALWAVILGLALLGCATARQHADMSGSPQVDRDGEAWARRTLDGLSVEEKVGQLFMIWVRSGFTNAADPEYREFLARLRRYHIGGLVMTVPVQGPNLRRGRPEEAALQLNRLQQASKLPLLVAADFETGVGGRLDGATHFPQAMAFGAAGEPEHARAFGRITAREARAVGVHWNFSPVADVNSNPENPIINTRSFGEDPQKVGELVAAYIEGARAGGLLTTAKHFPGHGDTATDSHHGVAQVGGDIARLEAVELPPFRRAIEAGVDAIMVAHATVPALEPSPDAVATTSPAIVTDLLRDKLGFDGVVVTDALDMAGLTRKYASDIGRAAVDTFKAGNDQLIIPADLDASWRSMVQATRSGEVSEERLDASVLRVLRWKAALGLHRSRVVDVARVASLVGRPEDLATAQQIADDAVVLVRDDAHVLPLAPGPARKPGLKYHATVATGTRLVVVVSSRDLRGDDGHILELEVRARVPAANVIFVDQAGAAGATEAILAATDRAEAVVVATFDAPMPGEAAHDARPGDRLLHAVLAASADKTIVVAIGSPYIAQGFPEIRSYLCTLSTTAVSQRSAVRALFGEFPIRGRLPVTIPGFAKRGDGLSRPATGR